MNGFNDAYRIDSTFRTAHHGADIANPNGFGGKPIEIMLPKGPNGKKVVLEQDDLKITAINVEHAPVEPAFGYRSTTRIVRSQSVVIPSTMTVL